MSGERDWRGRRLHFVGVAGSGMSGLARLCASLGATVSGSDRVAGEVLERLRRHGIDAVAGHAAENVPADAELVYSSAVKADNVERVRAVELGLPERRRGDVLAELAAARRCIAIAGTHGKTTTAAMAAHALRRAGNDAGYYLGAELRDGSPSSSWGRGEWFVVETDESDGTFLALSPEIAVVTNVALEHTKTYPTLEQLRDAFAKFVGRAGRAVVPPGLEALCGRPDPVTFAAAEVQTRPEGARFRWRGHEVRLPVPGRHNAENAAAALEACRLTGAPIDASVAALSTYPGVRRRLEPLGETPVGVRVYDDYAIHANEIRASLAALRTVETSGRIVVVFEPLLFSRTRAMASDLGAALLEADAVVVLELFAGSEAGEEHPGVSGALVADAARAGSNGRAVTFAATQVEAGDCLRSTLRAGDACVFMGVSAAPQRLARELLGPPR